MKEGNKEKSLDKLIVRQEAQICLEIPVTVKVLWVSNSEKGAIDDLITNSCRYLR